MKIAEEQHCRTDVKIMDQCEHCQVRGDLEKCLATNCSYHEVWMVQELKRVTKNEIITLQSIIDWIIDIIDGEEVSDFGLSFPIVRRVYERLHEVEETNPVYQVDVVCKECGKKGAMEVF
jgi:hypothetical protein